MISTTLYRIPIRLNEIIYHKHFSTIIVNLNNLHS
nr:MAG TPA_asm: hypothetical protein [Bacteriophage sp.]